MAAVAPSGVSMKILFIDCGSVLVPAASTNRLISLARGCHEAGHDVRIYSLGVFPGVPADRLQGHLYGIPFEHVCAGKRGFPANPGRAVKTLFAVRAAWACMFKLKKNAADAVVLINTGAYLRITRLAWMYLCLKRAGKLGIPVFHERNEYPHLGSRSLSGKILLWFYMRKIAAGLSGIAVMTRAVGRYFEERLNPCPPMIHIPMTVESDRFAEPGARLLAAPYIAYCGTVFGEKDGVPVLIEAFARVASVYPDLHLVLIGDDPCRENMDAVRGLIARLGISGRIVLTGRQPRETVVSWLAHAEVLALARPANLQAEGGFPTKLGEYLSTGRPVVVTATGEICDYLQDGVSAWIAEPGPVESFAVKLLQALDDRTRAGQIGGAGRAVAQSVFDFRVQGRRLAAFIMEFGR